MNERPTLSVIVPCYNERATVGELLRRVLAVDIDKEIIIVDDCSTDGSKEIVGQLALIHSGLRHILQESNQGKGAALRCGIEAAQGEYVLIQDADLEYDPSDYPRLLSPLIDGDADVVYGSRFEGYPRRVMLFWHRMGNTFLTFLSNMTTNLDLTDMETCYKAFRRDVIQSIHLESNRFGFEPEVTAKLARRGYRIYEVPISYYGRDYWEGKKINWKDGVSALFTILRYGLFTDPRSEPVGYISVRRRSRLKRYNAWVWDRVRSHIGERVLEIGAGTGTMTRFLYGRELVVATDREIPYVARLRNMFRRRPGIKVEQFDLERDEPQKLEDAPFDTVTCINALEHVSDDDGALRKVHSLLSPGGRVVIYAPADPSLSGPLDTAIGHRRRYRLEELRTKLVSAGFEVVDAMYHNRFARLAWWVNSRLLRRRTLPGGQSTVFDRLVPIFRALEGDRPSKGLSLIAIGQKPR